MSTKFIKNVEDFNCEHCNAEVKGDGYTNHCPKCLWSKHVDVYPGDRKSECNGLMKPVKFEKEGNDYIITHRCQKCDHTKRNKMSRDDNFDTALTISHPASK